LRIRAKALTALPLETMNARELKTALDNIGNLS